MEIFGNYIDRNPYEEVFSMDRRSNIYKNSGNNCDKNFQKFTTKIQF